MDPRPNIPWLYSKAGLLFYRGLMTQESDEEKIVDTNPAPEQQPPPEIAFIPTWLQAIKAARVERFICISANMAMRLKRPHFVAFLLVSILLERLGIIFGLCYGDLLSVGADARSSFCWRTA